MNLRPIYGDIIYVVPQQWPPLLTDFAALKHDGDLGQHLHRDIPFAADTMTNFSISEDSVDGLLREQPR